MNSFKETDTNQWDFKPDSRYLLHGGFQSTLNVFTFVASISACNWKTISSTTPSPSKSSAWVFNGVCRGEIQIWKKTNEISKFPQGEIKKHQPFLSDSDSFLL